jgi:hypothetical protein
MDRPCGTVTDDGAKPKATVTPGLEAPRVVTAPRRISHFVLLKQLGVGGMCVVFVTFDEKLERWRPCCSEHIRGRRS